MFDNAGNKLKSFGILFFWLGLICSVLLGFFYITHHLVWPGVLIMAAGSILSYAAGLVWAALGSLAESNEALWNINAQILETMRRRNPEPFSPSRFGGSRESSPSHESAGPGAEPQQPAQEEPEGWICPRCGCRNSGAGIYCKRCGHSH